MTRAGSHIITLEVAVGELEQLADQLGEAWGRPVIQLERPNHPHGWLELYFDQETEAEIALATFKGNPHIIATGLRRETPRDWETFWRHHFHARDIGRRLRIVPLWEKDSLANDSQRETIWLDPGLSFGTGDHFTTRFCLEMIDRVVDGKEIASMLDVGTGSSILAIAAARLGTRKTVGTDNDEIALEQARKNVELNGLAGQIELYTSDIMLAAPEGAFDLVCANVYTTVLIAIAPALAASTKKILVLSGIRDHELDEVAMAFTARGMKEFFRDGDGEWGGLAFRK